MFLCWNSIAILPRAYLLTESVMPRREIAEFGITISYRTAQYFPTVFHQKTQKPCTFRDYEVIEYSRPSQQWGPYFQVPLLKEKNSPRLAEPRLPKRQKTLLADEGSRAAELKVTTMRSLLAWLATSTEERCFHATQERHAPSFVYFSLFREIIRLDRKAATPSARAEHRALLLLGLEWSMR